MGAENIGYWLTDSENMEMAFAGLNLTTRDYAKLGGYTAIRAALMTARLSPPSGLRPQSGRMRRI